MSKLSLRQQIEELEQRAKIYPRLIASGDLRQSIAEYQVERLKAARGTLAWLSEHELAVKQRLAP